jgi:hypothetical protein
MSYVLHAVIAQIPSRDTLRQPMRYETQSRVRHHDLSAVSRGGESSRAIYVDPDIVVAAQLPFAGVQPHPDAKLPARPMLGSQLSLRSDGRSNGLNRIGKHCEKGVSFGAD